jgi:tetratricopeptide (TPR) repeat protein
MHLYLPVVLGTCLSLLVACTSAPPPPAPEQYFGDARANLATMDFEAALRNLSRAIQVAGEQPVGQQAAVLRAALLTAMADASKQFAEACTAGAKQSRTHVGQFNRLRTDYYGIARGRLVEAMETVIGQRAKLTNQPVPLAVEFPGFSGTDPPALGRLQIGAWVEETERQRAELEITRNALARLLARLVGAGEDVHKGRAAFEKGGVEIDPRIYLIELSDAFLRLSKIFERGALDDPRYRRISYEAVGETLDVALKLLADQPDKQLEARAKKIKGECEKGLKAIGLADL